MKNIRYFVFALIFIFEINITLCNNQQIDTVNLNNDKFRLEIGAGAAIASMSFSYINYDKLDLGITSKETFLKKNNYITYIYSKMIFCIIMVIHINLI